MSSRNSVMAMAIGLLVMLLTARLAYMNGYRAGKSSLINAAEIESCGILEYNPSPREKLCDRLFDQVEDIIIEEAVTDGERIDHHNSQTPRD